MDLSYILYDTAVFGTTALAESLLFQVQQGADGTHTESFTNSRMAGQLASGEKFLIKKVSAMIDFEQVAESDVSKVWNGSYVQIRLADQIVFWSPMVYLADASAFGGHFTEATAALKLAVGLMGDGYDLEVPILVTGGTNFKVRVVQGTALSAGSKNVKIALHGILTLP